MHAQQGTTVATLHARTHASTHTTTPHPSCPNACVCAPTKHTQPTTQGLRVVLNDGAAHAVDSNEMAFRLAAIGGFRQVGLLLLCVQALCARVLPVQRPSCSSGPDNSCASRESTQQSLLLLPPAGLPVCAPHRAGACDEGGGHRASGVPGEAQERRGGALSRCWHSATRGSIPQAVVAPLACQAQ